MAGPARGTSRRRPYGRRSNPDLRLSARRNNGYVCCPLRFHRLKRRCRLLDSGLLRAVRAIIVIAEGRRRHVVA